MATNQYGAVLSARRLASVSVLAVLFGILSVVSATGGAALSTAGVLAVIVGVISLLLSVGQYLRD